MKNTLKKIWQNAIRFTKITKHRKAFSVLCVTLIFGGVFFVTSRVHAVDLGDVGTGIANGMIYVISMITTNLAQLMMRLAVFMLEFFTQLAYYSDFMNSPQVIMGWLMIRDLANMFFIVALLLIAFGTILGLEQYEWKKGLVRLVLAAIFINFSKLILQMIIDAAHIFTITFLNAISDSAGESLVGMFHMDKILALSSNSDVIQGKDLRMDIFVGAVMGLFLACMIAFTIGAYLVIMVARLVVLWALMILSPLAFLAQTIPATKQYASEFWRSFTHQVIAAPLMVFFLWLSFATMGNGDIAVQLKVNPSQAQQAGADAAAAIGVQEKPETSLSQASTWENMSSIILAVAFLMIGIKTVQGLGIVGGSLVQGAEKFAKNVVTIASGVAAARALGRGGKDKLEKYGKQKLENVMAPVAATARRAKTWMPGVGDLARANFAIAAEEGKAWGAGKKGWKGSLQRGAASLAAKAWEPGGRANKRAADWREGIEDDKKFVEANYSTSKTAAGQYKEEMRARMTLETEVKEANVPRKLEERRAELLTTDEHAIERKRKAETAKVKRDVFKPTLTTAETGFQVEALKKAELHERARAVEQQLGEQMAKDSAKYTEGQDYGQVIAASGNVIEKIDQANAVKTQAMAKLELGKDKKIMDNGVKRDMTDEEYKKFESKDTGDLRATIQNADKIISGGIQTLIPELTRAASIPGDTLVTALRSGLQRMGVNEQLREDNQMRLFLTAATGKYIEGPQKDENGQVIAGEQERVDKAMVDANETFQSAYLKTWTTRKDADGNETTTLGSDAELATLNAVLRNFRNALKFNASNGSTATAGIVGEEMTNDGRMEYRLGSGFSDRNAETGAVITAPEGEDKRKLKQNMGTVRYYGERAQLGKMDRVNEMVDVDVKTGKVAHITEAQKEDLIKISQSETRQTQGRWKGSLVSSFQDAQVGQETIDKATGKVTEAKLTSKADKDNAQSIYNTYKAMFDNMQNEDAKENWAQMIAPFLKKLNEANAKSDSKFRVEMDANDFVLPKNIPSAVAGGATGTAEAKPAQPQVIVIPDQVGAGFATSDLGTGRVVKFDEDGMTKFIKNVSGAMQLGADAIKKSFTDSMNNVQIGTEVRDSKTGTIQSRVENAKQKEELQSVINTYAQTKGQIGDPKMRVDFEAMIKPFLDNVAQAMKFTKPEFKVDLRGLGAGNASGAMPPPLPRDSGSKKS